MKHKRKHIIIVGDRVLIQPNTGENKSAAGIYLPPNVIEKQDVRGGIIVEVGPGIPVGNPDEISEEPWKINNNGEVKYIPTQAEVGDYALFLSKASIEIKVEEQDYLILHQSAILVLIRDDLSSLTK